MTTKLNYRIRLVKDAEPGTGLGGHTVNDLVPRDADGWPVIPASHVKGLMRAALKEIASSRTNWCEAFEADEHWPRQLLDRVFGGYDQQDATGEAAFRFTDAVIPREDLPGQRGPDHRDWVEPRLVSRTAIGVAGIADQHSLRTTQSIPKGTTFHGAILCETDSGSIESLAVRLAMLSISAVGGSRNRGGQCVVDFLTADNDATNERPSQLLTELDAAINSGQFASREAESRGALSSISHAAATATVVELLFIAESPICCPEHADKSNVISSGFSLPASAVQGVILNHINRRNPDLATSLFNSDLFRCWPMNPCADTQDSDIQQILRSYSVENLGRLLDELPLSIRVSLSHRVAKYSLVERLTPKHFFDRAFADRNTEFTWPMSPEGAPLKAADGVLLYNGDHLPQQPALWKASHMRRKVTTHGVLDGPTEHAGTLSNGRNLFTVEAMAPLIWRGAISVPENVADALIASLQANPEVSVGKARTVRGLGRLIARRMPERSPFWGDEQSDDPTVLVLQSPALIPNHLVAELAQGKSGEQILGTMARQWLDHHGLPKLAKEPTAWANVGIRFGWSRHGTGGPGDGPGFQHATTVFLPGTVIALETKADPVKLRAAMLSGFRVISDVSDAGRTRGFGAVAVHPGQAHDLYHSATTIRRYKATPMHQAMEIVLKCQTLPHLPSPSQIRGVERRIVNTGDAAQAKASVAQAKEYLDEQCGRILKVWYDWECAYDFVVQLLNECDPASAKKALKSLAELSMARREDNR